MLRKLEKYEIEEELGHGGMATVYRARDTVLKREVALKVMHPHLRASAEARQRFHREAQSVARLRHPQVLEIYDFSGEGSDEAYIAAELLTGPTLKKWREDRQEVPAEIAACCAIEIAKALEAAHEAGIVHRDVKPENVLLHQARTLKLTDFGIADMIDAASMTATGQILGSPGHMAPEQIEGRDTDSRTDLFSLGTVLYYLATGRLPFTGRNPHQILKRIVDAEYADPLRVNPTIGGRLRAIIIKTLEKDPDDRYQTAAEVRKDLEAFVAEVGITDVEETLASYLSNPEEAGRALLESTITHLTERGSAASDAGEVPLALDYYNRVLALDEGNERVLKLIERVGLDRRKRAAGVVGAGLILVGALTSGAAYYIWTQPPTPIQEVGPIGAPSLDAGADVDARIATAEDASNPRTAEPDAGEPVDAGVQVAPIESGDAGRTRPPRGAHTTRRVLLRPNVLTAQISVDGSPPAELRAIDLSAGLHEVTLVPPASLAQTHQRTTVTIRVPRGSGDHIVPLTLGLKPARLSVECGVTGASVLITTRAGRARGHCSEVLYVPMPSVATTPEITVTPPGGEGFRLPTPPRIEAGADTRAVRVTLPEAAGAAP